MRHRAVSMSHSDLYMRYNNGRRGVAASCARPPLSFNPLRTRVSHPSCRDATDAAMWLIAGRTVVYATYSNNDNNNSNKYIKRIVESFVRISVSPEIYRGRRDRCCGCRAVVCAWEEKFPKTNSNCPPRRSGVNEFLADGEKNDRILNHLLIYTLPNIYYIQYDAAVNRVILNTCYF